MHILLNIVFAVQMLSAIAMVGLILVQHGKGADMGAAFGSGSAGSLFGSSGSANFLSHTTAVLATVFLLCTLTLAHFGNQRPTSNRTGSVLETPAAAGVPAAAPKAPESLPAAPQAPAPDAPAGAADTSQIPTK